MKKYLTLALTLLLSLSLAACGNKTAPDESTDPTGQGQDLPGTFEVKDTQDEFTKKLEPLTYAEGEEVESIYYKMVSVDGATYYEVQPAGEKDPLRIPIGDTVIYGIDEDDCRVEKVNLDIEEKGKSYNLSQYRLFVRLESDVVYTPNGTEADTPEPVNDTFEPENDGENTEAELEAETTPDAEAETEPETVSAAEPQTEPAA